MSFRHRLLRFLHLSKESHFDDNYGLKIASKRMANWMNCVSIRTGFYVEMSLLSFSFCLKKAMKPKICKKSVCFYCITTRMDLVGCLDDLCRFSGISAISRLLNRR